MGYAVIAEVRANIEALNAMRRSIISTHMFGKRYAGRGVPSVPPLLAEWLSRGTERQ
jgi:hypothetical protein